MKLQEPQEKNNFKKYGVFVIYVGLHLACEQVMLSNDNDYHDT